jgi:hypothetical protein
MKIGQNYSAQSVGDNNLIVEGNVSIGTTPPTQALDINGQIRIRGGNPADGRVLTSNATGVATWQNPSGGINSTQVRVIAVHYTPAGDYYTWYDYGVSCPTNYFATGFSCGGDIEDNRAYRVGRSTGPHSFSYDSQNRLTGIRCFCGSTKVSSGYQCNAYIVCYPN